MDTEHLPIPLPAGLLLRESDTNMLFRVVTPVGAGRFTMLFNIDDPCHAWPIVKPTADVQKRLNPTVRVESRLTIELNDPWSPDDPPARPNYDQTKLNSDWKLIEPLTVGADAVRIMFREHRNKILIKHAELNRTTRQRIARVVRRYWQRGLTLQALMDDMNRCGGKGKNKNCDKKKSGRRPRTGYRGVPVNETGRTILRMAAGILIADRKHCTYQGALDAVAKLFCNKPEVVIVDGQEVVIERLHRSEQPTVRQLQYIVLKEYPHSVLKRAKLGDKLYEAIGRAFHGRADQHVTCPGYVVIDATVADIYLVSIFDRITVVGRPTVYLAIDIFSRIILGIYVGFEPPSWAAAMMLAINIVTPKVAYCAQFGITITEDQWPCHHMPTTWFGDKGEMMKVDAGQRLTSEFHIHIENAPSGCPQAKSIVELRFRTVQRAWSPFAPGYVEKDFNERGARDYRLDAALTLYEFTQFMIVTCLQHNAALISNFPPIPDLVAEGGGPTPIQLWNYGIASTGGQLRNDSIAAVRRHVLLRDTASVTHMGLKFREYYYTCSAAENGDWFVRARKKRWKVCIAYDPSNLDYIWLCEGGRFEECKRKDGTNPRSTDLEGVTIAEHVLLHEQYEDNKEPIKDEHFELRVRVTELCETIAAEAQKKQNAALKRAGLSKPQLFDLRAARDRERSAEREDDANAIQGSDSMPKDTKRSQSRQVKHGAKIPRAKGEKPSSAEPKLTQRSSLKGRKDRTLEMIKQLRR